MAKPEKPKQPATANGYKLISIGGHDIPFFWGTSTLLRIESANIPEGTGNIAYSIQIYYLCYATGCQKAGIEAMSYDKFLDLLDTDVQSLSKLDAALAESKGHTTEIAKN